MVKDLNKCTVQKTRSRPNLSEKSSQYTFVSLLSLAYGSELSFLVGGTNFSAVNQMPNQQVSVCCALASTLNLLCITQVFCVLSCLSYPILFHNCSFVVFFPHYFVQYSICVCVCVWPSALFEHYKLSWQVKVTLKEPLEYLSKGTCRYYSNGNYPDKFIRLQILDVDYPCPLASLVLKPSSSHQQPENPKSLVNCFFWKKQLQDTCGSTKRKWPHWQNSNHLNPIEHIKSIYREEKIIQSFPFTLLLK